MRESLLETFDDIYIINLHGNSKRKETSPDGSKDQNVFDIMVGVSISIFVKQGEAITNRFSLDFFAYIYAILHSPSYRERYKEFLKIDFPRIPLPTDMAEYQRLVGLGKELIDLHLMKQGEAVSNRLPKLPNYPIAGSNIVEYVKFIPDDQAVENRFSLGKLYINDTQYFDHVPEAAYRLYIGGYQPAEKWLKDRKGRELSYNEICHYQHLIAALQRTCEIMQEIG